MMLRALVMLLLSAPVAADSVVFAAGNSMPPYVIPGTQNGIALERVRAALTLQNLQLQVLFGSNSENLTAFQSGAADAILIAIKDSPETYTSSQPIMTLRNVAISLKPRTLQQISDLARYRVGAFSLASQLLPQPFAETVQRSPSYKEYPRQIEQVRALFANEQDVLIMERTIFRYFFSQLRQQDPANPVYQQPPIYYELFPHSRYFAGFRDPQLRDQFDLGLQQLQRQGDYDAIRTRYEQLMDDYLLR
ncbi:substrate-binding periplasmic protein [Bacterioplanes sanyensis]|nr:transporter substrate-binding domain-containing protein [Bacterioplanes sanyensis]